MVNKEEIYRLAEELKTKRDELKVKMHLATMDTKDEFEEAEKKWSKVKSKASEITDGTIDATEDILSKTKIIGEELKETYHRIAKRLSE